MSDKVSIIVPFYNVAPYISRCLESLKNQTYKNLEIILVNDGSKDGSRKIVQKYCSIDKRFKLIDRTNGGVSAARNTGLDNISGDYVIFIDSDDWADPTFVEKMVTTIERDKSDLVCCRLSYVTSSGKVTNYGKSFKSDLLSVGLIEDALYVTTIPTPVWAKLYKSSLFTRYKLRFREGKVNEDTHFTCLLMMYVERVSLLNEFLCYSLEREGSISRSSQERLIRDMDTVLTELKASYIEKGVWTENIKDAFESRYVKAMLYNLLQAAQRLEYTKYIDIHHICTEETKYLLYENACRNLSLPHKILYKFSKKPELFFRTIRIMNALGFRMH